ncbi:MAG: flagellar biosynthesis protein FlaG [Zetaproteobacteria bacterium CG1_02_53_45]|nr:MAG: flagellar biosynthesis protein FlaG [Zetaproteobacteria bacterium CG1_02_53_45]
MAIIDTHMQSSPVLSSPNVGTAGVRSGIQQQTSSPAPAKQEVQQQAEPKVTRQDVEKAIQQANQAVSSMPSESISFGYEEKLGQLFVQVKDKESGEVIREIPSKEFIQHRIFMKEMVGILLDKQA